jgi:hypothetical protein
MTCATVGGCVDHPPWPIGGGDGVTAVGFGPIASKSEFTGRGAMWPGEPPSLLDPRLRANAVACENG